MFPLTCDAVLFDLDGVLVDSRAVVERTWARWGARHGLDGRHIAQTAHGRRSLDTVRSMAPWTDALAEVRWLESAELQDTDGLVALPGAKRRLAEVPARRCAVVTSGGRALARLRMNAAGLEMPPVLVAAEDVAAGKPAPEGYLLAAAQLGFAPQRCVVIEDAAPGIAAGLAAGATVIAITTTFGPSNLSAAHVTVESLASLRIQNDDTGLRIGAAPVGRETLR